MASGTKLFVCCLVAGMTFGLLPVRAAGAPDAEAPKASAAPKAEVPQAAKSRTNAPKTEMAKAEPGKPLEVKPSEAKPSESKSSESKPSVSKPSESKPADAKGGEGKASEGKAEGSKMDPKPDGAMSSEAEAGVRKYCVNIAAAATDARFAWQSKKLQELETQIKARILELDAKQGELKTWFDRRDTIAKQARESLVGIYTKMKPETAAAQISALDDDMAIAVLAALSPGKSSAIFNEIATDRAAKLAGMLANPLAQNDKKL